MAMGMGVEAESPLQRAILQSTTTRDRTLTPPARLTLPLQASERRAGPADQEERQVVRRRISGRRFRGHYLATYFRDSDAEQRPVQYSVLCIGQWSTRVESASAAAVFHRACQDVVVGALPELVEARARRQAAVQLDRLPGVYEALFLGKA